MAAVAGIKQVAMTISTETASSDSSDGANTVCKIKPLTPPRSSNSPTRKKSPRSPRSPRHYKKELIDENANTAGVTTSSDESIPEDGEMNTKTDSEQKALSGSPGSGKGSPGSAKESFRSAKDSKDDDEDESASDSDNLVDAGSNEEPEESTTEVKVSTPRVPAMTVEDTEDVPPGWKRRISQRMTGKSAGKYDVYIFSPEGRRFRSRPELMVHLKENKLKYTIDDFSFKYKGSSPKAKRIVKTPKPAPVKKRKITPMKRPLLEKKEQAKAKRKKSSPKKGRDLATKGPRKVQVPPDSKKDKASRSQAFEKLLVRMNFRKPGERHGSSSSESGSDDDDFDDGLV